MVQLTINFACKLGGIAIGPNGFDLMIVIIESNSSMIPFPTSPHLGIRFIFRNQPRVIRIIHLLYE